LVEVISRVISNSMQEQVLDHEEIERQLDADDLTLVDNWLKEHASGAGVAVVPGPAGELADIYYDTQDWRLYRAGYKLRVRKMDGQSAEKMVKLLKNMQDDLGDHQDLIVACGLMEELGVAGDRRPKVVFWMGTMSEGYLSEASKIRSGFLGSKSLRTLKDGKEWKKLRKTLEKRAGG
jgi:hypothetical protein